MGSLRINGRSTPSLPVARIDADGVSLDNLNYLGQSVLHGTSAFMQYHYYSRSTEV